MIVPSLKVFSSILGKARLFLGFVGFSFRGFGKQFRSFNTMDDLAQSWKRLTLSEREGLGSKLTTDHSTIEYSIAAKFLRKIAINMEVIARTFTPLWRAKNGFKIQRFGDHKLFFTFDNKSDVDRILMSEPWSVDNHLVVMERDTMVAHLYRTLSSIKLLFGFWIMAFR